MNSHIRVPTLGDQGTGTLADRAGAWNRVSGDLESTLPSLVLILAAKSWVPRDAQAGGTLSGDWV